MVVKTIAPWMAVRDCGAALQFYSAAFGAKELYRLEDAGRIVILQLAIGPADFWLQEESNASVPTGGGLIRMIITVDDPDTLFKQALAAGAKQINPLSSGHCWYVGRLADPFGYHWEIGKPLPKGSCAS